MKINVLSLELSLILSMQCLYLLDSKAYKCAKLDYKYPLV
jgi:hypothetical protein